MVNQDKQIPQLFLSRIDETYDPSVDHVMGPWCFIDSDDAYPEWEKQTFSAAFETRAEIDAAMADCLTLFKYYIGKLVPIMNERHSVQYSVSFWWIILGPWLSSIILATWRRWVHLEKTIKRLGLGPIKVQVMANSESHTINYGNTVEFMNHMRRSKHFDFWLFSLCFEAMIPENWIVEYVVGDANQDILAHETINKSRLSKLLRNLMGRMPFSHTPGVGRLGSLLFSLYVCLLPRKNNIKNNHLIGIEKEYPNVFSPTFMNVLDTVIKNTAIASLNMGFVDHNREAQKFRYHPGRLFVTSPSIHNEQSNYILGHAIQAGERIVRLQHGGASYGTLYPPYLAEITEYMAAARFLTWGWLKQGSCKGNFVPVCSPMLSRIQNRHKQKTNAVIFVGTTQQLNPDRYLRDINYIPRVRRDKVLFIKTLETQIQNAVLYRPYMRAPLDLDEIGYLEKRLPELTFLYGSLQTPLLKCRLLVLDNPGTTLHIALAANVPTICYWPAEQWHIAPEASPQFAALENAGILFTDAIAAAEKVNEIAVDVQAWWQGSEVQAARNYWAKSHAKTSGVWWLFWAKMLKSL